MVNKCIECGRIIDSTRIYCKACEAKIKERIKKREETINKINNADYFERQRIQ